MSIGPHILDDRRVGAVEIHQDVARISIFGIGLDVDVTSFAVTNAQKPDRGGMHQLGGRAMGLVRICFLSVHKDCGNYESACDRS